MSLDLGPNIITSLNKYFKGEVIEDYTCIKCSLRDFLAKYPKDLTEIGDRDTRQALEFLTRLKGTHDLDEELFVKEWREFKETTKNSCKLQIDKLHTRITKKFSIVTPPKILCLHLKRVYYDHMGNMALSTRHIPYPEYLDLSQIQEINQNGVKIDFKYKLTGVIEHFGTARGGHYVSYRKLFPSSDKWVLCDDSDVKIVEKGVVMKRNAYMLIYERLDEDEPIREASAGVKLSTAEVFSVEQTKLYFPINIYFFQKDQVLAYHMTITKGQWYRERIMQGLGYKIEMK